MIHEDITEDKDNSNRNNTERGATQNDESTRDSSNPNSEIDHRNFKEILAEFQNTEDNERIDYFTREFFEKCQSEDGKDILNYTSWAMGMYHFI
mmetsp:Transcript_12882/g.11413  ORF Transcript_12882/g.11413 Transcript_12882/m.11413 type:complete len:94 (+) Transcript_12882:575-856(+)